MAVMNAALGALGSGSQWAYVLQLLMQMTEERLKPNTISLNTALRACADASHWRLAVATFALFEELELKSSNISHTSLMGALANATRWQEAIDELMRLDRLPDVHADLIAYNAALTACSRSASSTAALQLLKDLEERGLKANITSYNIALSCLAGAWESALMLLEEVDEGLGLEALTLRVGFDALRGAPLELALSFHRRAVDLDLMPSLKKVTDLHEFPAETALVWLCATLLDAALRDESDLILICGQGKHSRETPVLAPTLLEFLASLPVEADFVEGNRGRLQVNGASLQRWARGDSSAGFEKLGALAVRPLGMRSVGHSENLGIDWEL